MDEECKIEIILLSSQGSVFQIILTRREESNSLKYNNCKRNDHLKENYYDKDRE